MKEESKIVENLENEVQEDVLETVEENISKDEEVVSQEENISEEAVSEVENIGEEESEEVIEQVISQAGNLKKHDQAIVLVAEAKGMVKDAENQMKECKLVLSDDLKGYEQAKKDLKGGGLDESEVLLSKLAYVDDSEEIIEEGTVFEVKEDLVPIRLQDISSGKFTSFLMSLIGGMATLGAMVYVATEKLGVTLDISKVPTPETIKPVFAYYGTLIGMNENANIGMALVAVVTLFVMWIIYAVRVSSKGNKNLHFATQQLEEAKVYTSHKSNCKEEMDKVDVHIHDAIETLKTYQVLLNEQQGKLQRILYIEGEQEESSEYHAKSFSEMKETQSLINSIRSFMATPMSEEGKLSGKSEIFLHNAKGEMQKMIEGLY